MTTAPTSPRKLTAAALACLALGAVAIPATAGAGSGPAANAHHGSHHVAPGRAHVPPAIRDAG